MADSREENTRFQFNLDKTDAKFDIREREYCMDGSLVNGYLSDHKTNLNPGELCMLYLEHSADVQRDPKLLRQYPRHGLLQPYSDLMQDRKFAGDMKDTLWALTAFNSVGNAPGASNAQVGHLPVPSGGNDKPLTATSGLAWDAGFTKVVLDYIQSNTKPASAKKSMDQIQAEATDCFNNTRIGVCYNDGKDHAYYYLQKHVAALPKSVKEASTR